MLIVEPVMPNQRWYLSARGHLEIMGTLLVGTKSKKDATSIQWPGARNVKWSLK